MKRKIIKMHLYYENEVAYEILERGKIRWLFIAEGAEFKKISLSGDDRTNAFLLKMLDIAITETISDTNKIGGRSS